MIRLNDEFTPSSRRKRSPTQVSKMVALLQQGDPSERQRALVKLIEATAERELSDCLRSPDALVVQLATSGLWECWLNEKGAAARQAMDEGIELMNAGHLAAAEKIFLALIKQYPDWAEAINKEATLLYMRGDATESIQLCTKVVALKPDHFGAWNGMALCAVRLEDWRTALFAAKKALRIQPTAESNKEIIQLAEAKLRDL
jgi:tetratricopeptide (TPR) repeat protein